jgi:hypothetical protein
MTHHRHLMKRWLTVKENVTTGAWSKSSVSLRLGPPATWLLTRRRSDVALQSNHIPIATERSNVGISDQFARRSLSIRIWRRDRMPDRSQQVLASDTDYEPLLYRDMSESAEFHSS